MHNGAFACLDDVIRHHLNVMDSAMQYTPASQNLPIVLTESQFEQLLTFVRDGLLYPRATPERLQRLIPHTVPSGRPLLVFEFP